MLQHHCSGNCMDIRMATLVQAATVGKGVKDILFDDFLHTAKHEHPPPTGPPPERAPPPLPQGEHMWVPPIDWGRRLVGQPQKRTTREGHTRYQEPKMPPPPPPQPHPTTTTWTPQPSKTRRGALGPTAPPGYQGPGTPHTTPHGQSFIVFHVASHEARLLSLCSQVLHQPLDCHAAAGMHHTKSKMVWSVSATDVGHVTRARRFRITKSYISAVHSICRHWLLLGGAVLLVRGECVTP